MFRDSVFRTWKLLCCPIKDRSPHLARGRQLFLNDKWSYVTEIETGLVLIVLVLWAMESLAKSLVPESRCYSLGKICHSWVDLYQLPFAHGNLGSSPTRETLAFSFVLGVLFSNQLCVDLLGIVELNEFCSLDVNKGPEGAKPGCMGLVYIHSCSSFLFYSQSNRRPQVTRTTGKAAFSRVKHGKAETDLRIS